MAREISGKARRGDTRQVQPQVDTRVESLVRATDLGTVAAILRARQADILRSWLETTRLQPFHAGRPDAAVANHIPQLFDALVAYLEHAAPRFTDPGAPLHDAGVSAAAQAHATERFAQGLGAADTLTEFRILRQEIGGALRAHVASEGTADVVSAELLVHDTLDGAATIALVAMEEREAARRALAAEVLRLGAERDRLLAMLNQAHDAVFAWELGGPIVFWNRGAQELYGHTAAEASGRISHELLGTPPWQTAAFLAALEHAGRWEGELHHRTRDGTPLLVETRLVLVRQGERAYALESTRDVTARRRVEEALRASETRATFLAEAGAVLAGSLDYAATLANVARLAVPRLADWCVIDVLEAGVPQRLAVVHSDPARVALAEELRRRFAPDLDVPRGIQRVLRTGATVLVAQGATLLDEEAGLDAEDRAVLQELGMDSYLIVPLFIRGHVLGAISLVAAEARRPYGSENVATVEELARRAALAVESARLYREAQDALRTRDEVLGAVTHDLRTPLTVIDATAQFLAAFVAADDGEQRAAALQRIHVSAQRMARMLDELLDAARLEAGQRPELERRTTDLVALARTTAMAHQTPRHTITVVTPVPALVGAWDTEWLHRVLDNLLTNAVKYSPAGGPVEVTIEQDQDHAVVQVRDQGLGIPAADLARIFERFHRATNVTRRLPGMGLGLASVKHIVEAHGGTVTVESSEGQGSTFRVRLPRGPLQGQTDETPREG